MYRTRQPYPTDISICADRLAVEQGVVPFSLVQLSMAPIILRSAQMSGQMAGYYLMLVATN
jgi:hypothetical protein